MYLILGVNRKGARKEPKEVQVHSPQLQIASRFSTNLCLLCCQCALQTNLLMRCNNTMSTQVDRVIRTKASCSQPPPSDHQIPHLTRPTNSNAAKVMKKKSAPPVVPPTSFQNFKRASELASLVSAKTKPRTKEKSPNVDS